MHLPVACARNQRPALFPSLSRFRGWWGEGTPEKEFEDGVFSIYAVTALDAYANYTAVIDRSSSLKSSCGHPVSLCLPPHPRHIQVRPCA